MASPTALARRFLLAVVFAAGALAAACGSGSSHPPPLGPRDSGPSDGSPADAPVDSGPGFDALEASRDSAIIDVSTADAADAGLGPDGADAERADAGYPAAHADPPQVQSYGGPVMTAPNVVPIFFANDPEQTQVEQFLTALAASPYWAATTAEYGVGPLTVSPSIVVTDPLPTMTTDDAIQTWLAAYLDGTHAAWPAIAMNNIYMVFYQEATTVTATFGGSSVDTSCVNFGGYHEEGAQGDLDAAGVPFVYAVIPRCTSFAGLTGIDGTTGTMSHEIAEAATDPLVNTNAAFDTTDENHIVWDLSPLPEVGDMCAFEPQSFQRLVGNFMVQRIWSNTAALAGGDPCVPVLTTPYFNVSPILTDSVTLTLDGQAYPTLGIQIPVGQTKMVSFQFFSSAPAAAWTAIPEDTSAAFNGPQLLSFSPSQFSGSNGDVVQVAVTAVAAGPVGGAELLVQSYRPGVNTTINYWFGFVQN